MDVHSKKIRSFNMSQIRAKKTKPEVLLSSFLKNLGYKLKSNVKSIDGTPDLYLPELNLIIQIHGCFWHMHNNCRYFKLPKSNVLFWKTKLQSNVDRDLIIKKKLKARGYRQLCIWECDLKNGKFLDKLFFELKLAE